MDSILLILGVKISAKDHRDREEAMQSSKQKGLLNYPKFHFQKLRVVKTLRKYMALIIADGSNSYRDPTSSRLSLMGDLASARNTALLPETVCPHITNILDSDMISTFL